MKKLNTHSAIPGAIAGPLLTNGGLLVAVVCAALPFVVVGADAWGWRLFAGLVAGIHLSAIGVLITLARRICQELTRENSR